MSAVPGEAALAAARLGVLGGSFDPPHRGHLHVAERARAAFGLDHVLLVPAARPPHKPDRILADGAQRLAMLAALCRTDPFLSPWGVELERSGPSYTVDTLRALRAAVAPPTALYFLMGADNLPGFPGWREVETIVRLAQPVVVPRRSGLSAPAVDPGGLSSFARVRLAIGMLRGEPVEVSSTELRAQLSRGETPAALPPAVAEYLRGHPVYSPRAGTP
jgi:nicotinate-nucleotide adenylyltransferase